MDEKLTHKIQDYLDTPPSERDVVAGATLLLSLNRNKILFQNVIRKPEKFADKVEYELRKHLKIRLDGKTVSDIALMNITVIPSAQRIIDGGVPVLDVDDEFPEANVAKGRRMDHDRLPPEIQRLWTDNGALWFKIKELFEQLKGMESAPACDRYEYLKLLDEADKKYRANLQAYDDYKPGDPVTKTEDAFGLDPAEIAKKVGAARKYLSDNKKKLAELKDTDAGKFTALLQKVQQRYDFLIATGNVVDETQAAELAAVGVTISTDEKG